VTEQISAGDRALQLYSGLEVTAAMDTLLNSYQFFAQTDISEYKNSIIKYNIET
jgi:hypothetical protein